MNLQQMMASDIKPTPAAPIGFGGGFTAASNGGGFGSTNSNQHKYEGQAAIPLSNSPQGFGFGFNPLVPFSNGPKNGSFGSNNVGGFGGNNQSRNTGTVIPAFGQTSTLGSQQGFGGFGGFGNQGIGGFENQNFGSSNSTNGFGMQNNTGFGNQGSFSNQNVGGTLQAQNPGGFTSQPAGNGFAQYVITGFENSSSTDSSQNTRFGQQSQNMPEFDQKNGGNMTFRIGGKISAPNPQIAPSPSQPEILSFKFGGNMFTADLSNTPMGRKKKEIAVASPETPMPKSAKGGPETDFTPPTNKEAQSAFGRPIELPIPMKPAFTPSSDRKNRRPQAQMDPQALQEVWESTTGTEVERLQKMF
ncbi:hypothetical protein ABW20_dc0101398 [Dactylellina cionopaga]|nr:hypothetical protein ABW20_dc0101398 [Dactylellina cionopaga]